MTLAIALVALGLAVLSGFAVGFTFMRAAQHVWRLQQVCEALHAALKAQQIQIVTLEESCRESNERAKLQLH